MNRGRLAAFVVVCLVCAIGAVAYVRHAIRRVGPQTETVPARNATDASGPFLLFRSTARDGSYGKLALAPLDRVSDRHMVSTFSCNRVDFAGGRGVCLTTNQGVVTTYAAIIFDGDFNQLATLGLGGAPSRVRVSPDGRLAAVTVFVSGHSYTGSFSTLTSIIDLQKGAYVVPDFEKLTVWDGQQRFEAVDRNFWGVTFARDSNRYYATVGSGGRMRLIEGDVSSGAARVQPVQVECPSLSPDNSRIAFKHRVQGDSLPVHWQLMLLDLRTRTQTPLAETRSVDDQVAWLDNDRIAYALPAAVGGSSDTWVVAADGTGAPTLLLPESSSAIAVAALSDDRR